jgi:hypothetical protein
MDATTTLSSDTAIIDPTTTMKTDNDDTEVESSSLPDDSTEPNYHSSLSFVDLVETIFLKKEDIKPVEQVPIDIKEEIPLLSTEHQSEPETLIPNNSEEMGMTSD